MAVTLREGMHPVAFLRRLATASLVCEGFDHPPLDTLCAGDAGFP